MNDNDIIKLKTENYELRELCSLLNWTAISFDKTSERYKKSLELWNKYMNYREFGL